MMRLMVGLGLAAAVLLALSCSGTPTAPSALPRDLAIQRADAQSPATASPLLSVATLNVAHGRGDSLNQLLVSGDSTRRNLNTIGRFLEKQAIHVAALQEVDSPSWWSGGFDHTTYLAELAGFPYWAQAAHASLGVGHYGTAVLSRFPIRQALALDFAPSPPTATKGFTLAEVAWPAGPDRTVILDVISIHMDFSRKSVRRSQLQELEQVMAQRRNPLVLMGDFNSEGLAERLLRATENSRRLHTVPLQAGVHSSYKDKRLDWIIVSGEFEIVDYRTAPEVLSDHRAVLATLALRQTHKE